MIRLTAHAASLNQGVENNYYSKTMKQTNVFVHEYRTPVCKVVRVHVEKALLSVSDGIEDVEGEDVTTSFGL